MVKFAHFADCHLGSWRQDELQSLNFKSFQKAIEICLLENVDFILISGDLFDSAYPPIEILKETFAEFKKVHDAKIPVFLIAGSHDFSASGKTFLDVLEKAGFCKNIENFIIEGDEKNQTIMLSPHIYKNIAIFGYSGKKSSMEIEDLRKIKFDSIHPTTIFMIHTTISDVVGNLPMASIDKLKLPLANYYAMGHIHQVFEKQESGSVYVYPGPIFPNNFQELVDLEYGSFQMVEIENGKIRSNNIKLPLKEVAYLELIIDNGLIATEKIISAIDKLNLSDKIFLLKLKGTMTQGKTGDIRFNEIEEFVSKKQPYIFLRNISAIKIPETELELEADGSENVEHIEEKIIKEYAEKNPADFNKFLPQLMNSLSIEKNEDEKSTIFENRLIDDLIKILNLQGAL
ncbi:MAG: exonuclease SbcCD subunit D [archaeon]